MTFYKYTAMKINRITPQEYKRTAAAMPVEYGFCTTPFGEGMIAWRTDGICFVGFAVDGREALLSDLAWRWAGSALTENPARAQALAGEIFDPQRKGHGGLSICLKGTPFQTAVWEELLRIPFGQTTSYAAIAAAAGRPQAVRAAGSAVGRNDLSYLVPCHRVVRGDGSPGGYYWGLPCKRAILDWEKKYR